MDRAMAEVLHSRVQYQDISNDVPQLPEAEARDVIPVRLREKSAPDEISSLDPLQQKGETRRAMKRRKTKTKMEG